VRADTPGVAHVVHFNNAGAALMPRVVSETVKEHIDLESRIGGYRAAAEEANRIDSTYGSIAELLACAPDEIAMHPSATSAWDMAFYGLAADLCEGDVILTAQAEYASNYVAYLQVVRRTGCEVKVVPNDEHGQIDVAALEGMIDSRVRLIGITHIPTNGGLVNPVARVGEVARRHGILYLLDACQSVGQLSIDVEEIGCDFLSATGRKYLRGPRGTGFLYVRRDALDRLEPAFIDLKAAVWTAHDAYTLRPDARRFESWEANIGDQLGLGAAVRYALDLGLDAIEERISQLAERLRTRLLDVPGVSVTDLGEKRCGLVSFAHERWDPAQICPALEQRDIQVAASPRQASLLDMDDRGIDSLTRASIHYYNDDDEIERFCEALAEITLRSPE